MVAGNSAEVLTETVERGVSPKLELSAKLKLLSVKIELLPGKLEPAGMSVVIEEDSRKLLGATETRYKTKKTCMLSQDER